jgi:Glycosyl transferase family 90
MLSTQGMHCYGTAIAIADGTGVRFVMEGATGPNARTATVVRLMREILPDIAGADGGALALQINDFAHNDLCSLAFCKRAGEAPGVRLIPDTYFLSGFGYRALRQSLDDGRLPLWDERKDILFWRGTPTTRGVGTGGEAVRTLEDIPRVKLCLLLRQEPKSDAAIVAPWGFQFAHDEAVRWFREQGIFRASVAALQQAEYRYLVDIDGVANAWGFFEKLLLGSCILKVQSPFEQWFYRDIEPWKHYVPVREDLSDLEERFDWCRANSGEARLIGERPVLCAGP